MWKVWVFIFAVTCVYGQKTQQASRSVSGKHAQAKAHQQAASHKQVVQPKVAPQKASPEPPQEPVVEDQPRVQPQPVPNEAAAVAPGEHALPLPRFVALRATANMHVGPGQQYPVDWQYVIPNFPMEILAEFGHWRQVRDFQGTRGWLHKSLLTGKRYVLIVNNIQNMTHTPHAQGKVVARLSPGVVGRVIQIQGDWCKLNVKWEDKTYKGWVEKRNVWGIYGHETHF